MQDVRYSPGPAVNSLKTRTETDDPIGAVSLFAGAAGLAIVTHTPSPMAFLNEIPGRPRSAERPIPLPVTGYPDEKATVPVLCTESCTWANIETEPAGRGLIMSRISVVVLTLGVLALAGCRSMGVIESDAGQYDTVAGRACATPSLSRPTGSTG